MIKERSLDGSQSEDWVVDVDKLKAQLGDKWPEKSAADQNLPCEALPPLPKPLVQAPRIKDGPTPADR